MSFDLRIDDKAILDALSKLRKPEMTEIVLKALKKGGEKLQADTKLALRKNLGKGATSTIKRRKPMLSGISLKADEQYLEVRVSLLGDFRLKWFEMGTEERKLKRTGAKDRVRGRTKGDKRYLYRKRGKENFYKSGANRGKIKALNFYESTRARDELRVMYIIEEEISKGLQNLLR